MKLFGLIAFSFLLGSPHALPTPPGADPARMAKAYVDAVRDVNEDHARKPGETREDELAKELPKKARKAFSQLLGEEDSPEVRAALLRSGQAALELALVEDFEAVRERLASFEAGAEAELGVALARERFLLLGHGGLTVDYLTHFAEVFDAILVAYDEVFGFEEWSKVPGKKLRVLVHLEERITRPPHFAPQFPFHSQIDFPVIDPERLRSPTRDGKFLFYGLCHELGHVIAMWGRRDFEEDHHAWAHYTGVVIVEHISKQRKAPKWMSELKDVRWRSLESLRKEHAEVEANFESRGGVLAFLVRLHDAVGPRAIGDALNHADEEDDRLRVNRVRYYSFDELRDALNGTLPKKDRKQLKKLWPR